MTEPVLKLQQVTKVFETEKLQTHALRDIDLSVGTGDYVAISGPSGCGKSTLLSIMGLLDSVTSGQYFIDGVSAIELSLNQAADLRNRKIGFVFQSFNLIDELSILDNVALPLRYRSEKMSDAAIVERSRECLARLQLDHRADHKPSQLSGGQQQRAAIARAIASKPAVLLADEPTGNLDLASGNQVMETFAALNDEGVTICIVTHNPRFADMAKTKVSLLDGQIVV
jgi:putative ABC transport system ATP-binding protein